MFAGIGSAEQAAARETRPIRIWLALSPGVTEPELKQKWPLVFGDLKRHSEEISGVEVFRAAGGAGRMLQAEAFTWGAPPDGYRARYNWNVPRRDKTAVWVTASEDDKASAFWPPASEKFMRRVDKQLGLLNSYLLQTPKTTGSLESLHDLWMRLADDGESRNIVLTDWRPDSARAEADVRASAMPGEWVFVLFSGHGGPATRKDQGEERMRSLKSRFPNARFIQASESAEAVCMLLESPPASCFDSLPSFPPPAPIAPAGGHKWRSSL